MKQVLQSYRSGELWLAEVPPPMVQAEGVGVRTAYSVISSGTERMLMELAQQSLIGKARSRPDLVEKVIRKIKTEGLVPTLTKVFAKLDTPIAMGYSCAGTVCEAGAAVSDFQPGDRVACGGAGYASHAEYNYVPQRLCARIPDGVDLADAAFTTIGAIALQGVRRAEVTLGDRVAVLGLGLIGLLTVQMLKSAGCSVLGYDPDPGRCKLADDCGADESASAGLAETAAAFTDGHGMDAVIITAATSSNEPIETAAEILRLKGRVVVVGAVKMDVPRDPFYKKELDLRLSLSYGPGRYDPRYEEQGIDYPYAYVRWTEQRNMQSFLELVARGSVTPSRLVTQRYKIEDALEGYALLSGDKRPLGILLEYGFEHETVPRRTITLRSAQHEMPGIGFIGAGSFASGVLLPALKNVGGINLVGIATATGTSGERTARKYGFAYATTDGASLIRDRKIDAVAIATRHDTHASLVCDALREGKHVFVEKPLALNKEELEEIESVYIAKVEAAPVLMVGFNRRFSRHAGAVRDVFANRSTPLIMIYRINAGSLPPDSWIRDPSRGGGRIIGEFCHFLDLCEFITGSPARRVYAASIRSDNIETPSDDTFSVTINYEDGSLAALQYLATGAKAVAKERVEIHAGGISAVIEDFTATRFFGTRRGAVKGRQDKGFEAEMTSFVRAVKEGGKPPIPAESLFRTTRATFAVRDSLRLGTAIDL